jgi:hypothetical protein
MRCTGNTETCVKLTYDDLDHLFPRLGFTIGAYRLLCAPDVQAKPAAEAEPTEVECLMCALADQLCQLSGRTLTPQQIIWVVGMMSDGLGEFITRANGEPPWPGMMMSLLEDGQSLVAVWDSDWTPVFDGESTQHVRARVKVLDLNTNTILDPNSLAYVPVVTHVYNVTGLYVQLKSKLKQIRADRNAVNVATAEVADYKRDLEQSGCLRNDLADNPT